MKKKSSDFPQTIADSPFTIQDLLGSRQKYMALVDNLPHSIFLKDNNCVYISCNKAYAEDVGRVVNEIPGLTDFDLFPRHQAENYQKKDQEVLQSGSKIEYEDNYTTRSSLKIVKIIKMPVHDALGKISGILGIIWDITKEKRYEAELLEKEKQFRRLLDKASDSITLADMKGKIVEVNSWVCEVLGYTCTELRNDHMGHIDPGIWSQNPASAAWNKLSEEEAVITESIYHRKDGSTFPVEISMALHHEGGKNLVLSIARDITPRHLALKQRAGLGKIVEDSLNETFILLRDRLLFIQANRGARENIQYTAEELKTKTIGDICPELAGKKFSERVKPLDIDALDRIHFETVFLRKDGTSYPAEISIQAAEFLFYPVFVIQAQDITTRREYEEKLHTAYDIINTSGTVAFIWQDKEGLPITYVSENVQKLLGYNAEEMTSQQMSYTQLIHPDNLAGYQAEIRNISHNIRQNIINHCTYRIITKSNEIKWVSEHTYIKRDEHQNILYFQGIVEDITLLKENEFALRRSKEQWEQTFHAIPDIVALLDANLQIIKINEAGCRQFALPCAKITGMHCYELFGNTDAQCNGCPTIDSLTDFKPYTKEIYHEKLKKTFLVTSSPVPDENHAVANIALVVKDITERKKLEAQLFQSEKLATIAGLAAGVAHEINTPLSAILQSIMVVHNSLDNSKPDNLEAATKCGVDLNRVNEYCHRMEIDFFLNGIKESALKAAKIITTLLDFSRPQKGDMKKVDINALLDDSIHLAQADYNLKMKYDILNFTIHREYAPKLPLVTCVPMEIEQVILNLIKNAVQAVEDDGKKKKPRLILRTFEEDGLIRIEVEDNGPGISEDVKRHIFDPFYTTKEVGLGTGLGLSVSFAIIHDKHRGTIEVESAPGRGATFVIKIPINTAADI